MGGMFKGIASFFIAVGVLYQADHYLYDGRHSDALITIAQNVARSFGI
jgi:hypothetical protein